MSNQPPDKPTTISVSKSNEITAVRMPKATAPSQRYLPLNIEKQVEIDGVGMGVLSDGTAFLTGRGLARLCGIDHTMVSGITAEWNESQPKPRIAAIKKILQSHGLVVDEPYVALEQKGGVFHAYPDIVCLAILEYYAFDAGANIKEHAKTNFRLLAGKSLHDFIYVQVGYDPSDSLPSKWKHFHDRLSLTYDSVPSGYFGIFKEMSDMIVTLGQANIHIDSSFVPDISVGIGWARHWSNANLEQKFGPRIKYEHNYPDYFPQATSNPQLPWCYPEAALGEFRRWLREQYIGEGKFENYLVKKVREKQLPPSFAQLAIEAYKGAPELTE